MLGAILGALASAGGAAAKTAGRGLKAYGQDTLRDVVPGGSSLLDLRPQQQQQPVSAPSDDLFALRPTPNITPGRPVLQNPFQQQGGNLLDWRRY